MYISIIIPVYNKQEYLNNCIMSAVEQDYENIEIIIINDGSQDNSENIINTWVSKDNRIKYITQKNKGVSFSRNVGISVAKGDYIFFLDADDMLTKNAISTLVQFAEQTKADIVVGNVYVKQSGVLNKSPGYNNLLLNETNLHLTRTQLEMFIIRNRHMAMAGNKLYKLKFLKMHELAFLDGVISEDRLFNLMCYVSNPVIKIVNEYTYIYNVINNSRSRGVINSTYYNESISLVHYFYNYLKEKSIIEYNVKLFHLIVIYDVNRILSHTYKNANKKISMTNLTIKKLKNDSLINETISSVFQHDNLKTNYGGNIFLRMRLTSYLLLKAPKLIVYQQFIRDLAHRIKKLCKK